MPLTTSLQPRLCSLALVLGLVGHSPCLLAQVNPLEPGSSCAESVYSSYGPFDYRTAHENQKRIVENAHFTARVESLRRGMTAENPAGDIRYTLVVFPNHHRALVAMTKLAEKEGANPLKMDSLTVDCWYERAIRWRADDPVVRMLYANFMIRQKRSSEALTQLDYVVSKAYNNPFTQYNAGLLYLQALAFDKALLQAHLAIAEGVTRTELQNGLKAAGKWREPPPVAAAAGGAASAP